MSRRASGETPQTFSRDGKSKYALKVKGKQQAQKNVQGFLDIFLSLQHHGEFEAALDLSREVYSAACARKYFYKLNQRKFK